SLVCREADGSICETSVELDDLLVAGVVDATTPGLFRIGADGIVAGSPRLSISALHGVPASTEVAGLGLRMEAVGGRARLRIGPLSAKTDATPVVLVKATLKENVLQLDFDGAAGKLLIAHFPSAAVRAAAALSAVDAGVRADVESAVDTFAAGCVAAGARDATRVGPAEAFRRGFSLWQGTPSVVIQGAAAGDEVAVFADRGALLVAGGAPAVTGSRALISFDGGTASGGTPAISIVSRTYRPATATALAEIGGGRSVSLASASGPVIAGRRLERAADLAEAVWQRQRARGSALVSPLTGQTPEAERSTLSPVIAALAGRLPLPPVLAEELDAEALDARLAFAFLAFDNPALARRTAMARTRLTNKGKPAPETGHAADWLLRAEAPALISRAVNRLAGEPMAAADRRERQLLLDELAHAAGGDWINVDRLIAGWRIASTASEGEIRISALLTTLAADSVRLAKAQRDAQSIDMGVLARLRAELPARSGLDAALAAELARDLPNLAPRDLMLLDAHFSRETAERSAISAIGAALVALEAAAGAEGVAAGQDRSGDALLGMSRLAAVTEPALRALLRLPAAHASVRDLNRWLAAAAPEPQAEARTAALLRRSLQIFAFFLLYRDIAAEAAAAACEADTPELPARRALMDRLQAGLVETLPKLVAAGEARHGERSLGQAFIGRLPASDGISLP
ncbi:MAG: hypothetical protein ACRC7G_08090, partial [Beijerinckiaceae bacterium]